MKKMMSREQALWQQGRNLKKIRTNAKLTQKEIACRLHVSVSTYQRWETGKIMLRLTNLYKILCELDIPADELFAE